MRVTAVRIENFRGIKHLELELDETTVLIGENNSGKTAVLAALQLCLRDLGSRRRTVFDTLDFHLPDADAEPSSAKPIQIEVSFSEQKMNEWDDQLVGRLSRDRILQGWRRRTQPRTPAGDLQIRFDQPRFRTGLVISEPEPRFPCLGQDPKYSRNPAGSSLLLSNCSSRCAHHFDARGRSGDHF